MPFWLKLKLESKIPPTLPLGAGALRCKGTSRGVWVVGVLAPPRFALGCSPRLRPPGGGPPPRRGAGVVAPNRVEHESVPCALEGTDNPSALNAQKKKRKGGWAEAGSNRRSNEHVVKGRSAVVTWHVRSRTCTVPQTVLE